ncbi:hypothetical protein ACP275_12G019100 [Erythranthe tilingii]
MLSDEHRREIQFALEYAMLANLDQLPPPMPPPVTWSEIYQKLLNFDTVAPVPVPPDWKPSLKLPTYMLETLSFLELKKKISKLQDHMTDDMVAYSKNGYLGRAHTYLSTANFYLIKAHNEEDKARFERMFMANQQHQ